MMDPTKLISTYDRAEALAHAMLLLAPDPSPEFWRCTSEPVLSMLLYTGSAGQRGGGLAWVNEAVATLAVDNGDAAGAVSISDPARGQRRGRTLNAIGPALPHSGIRVTG